MVAEVNGLVKMIAEKPFRLRFRYGRNPCKNFSRKLFESLRRAKSSYEEYGKNDGRVGKELAITMNCGVESRLRDRALRYKPKERGEMNAYLAIVNAVARVPFSTEDVNAVCYSKELTPMLRLILLNAIAIGQSTREDVRATTLVRCLDKANFLISIIERQQENTARTLGVLTTLNFIQVLENALKEVGHQKIGVQIIDRLKNMRSHYDI